MDPNLSSKLYWSVLLGRVAKFWGTRRCFPPRTLNKWWQRCYCYYHMASWMQKPWSKPCFLSRLWSRSWLPQYIVYTQDDAGIFSQVTPSFAEMLLQQLWVRDHYWSSCGEQTASSMELDLPNNKEFLRAYSPPTTTNEGRLSGGWRACRQKYWAGFGAWD